VVLSWIHLAINIRYNSKARQHLCEKKLLKKVRRKSLSLAKLNIVLDVRIEVLWLQSACTQGDEQEDLF
jgi:hypothetical protein